MSSYPFFAYSQKEKFPWIDLNYCWENQFLWLCNAVYYSQGEFSEVIYNLGMPLDKYNLLIKFCELTIDLTPSSFVMNFPSSKKPVFLASESRRR